MKILFINACPRKDSRTLKLASYLLSKLDGDVIELNLMDLDILPLNAERLDKRNKLLSEGRLDAPIFKEARLFKESNLIVIATPYYDLSFSAYLKTFIEHINIDGLTFKFTDDGKYQKMCKAKVCYYITTSGGELYLDYGFNYIKNLCQLFYGIDEVKLIKAENLDIVGIDVEKELDKAKQDIDKLFK